MFILLFLPKFLASLIAFYLFFANSVHINIKYYLLINSINTNMFFFRKFKYDSEKLEKYFFSAFYKLKHKLSI